MQVYPNAALLKRGQRLLHITHGYGVVSRKTPRKNLPYAVWLKMESDGVEGTVDIRLCKWPE